VGGEEWGESEGESGESGGREGERRESERAGADMVVLEEGGTLETQEEGALGRKVSPGQPEPERRVRRREGGEGGGGGAGTRAPPKKKKKKEEEKTTAECHRGHTPGLASSLWPVHPPCLCPGQPGKGGAGLSRPARSWWSPTSNGRRW